MTVKIAYGTDPSQFGELSLPSSPGMTSSTAVPATAGAPGAAKLPVVVLIHGGFWRAQYGLDLEYPMATDLVDRGYAVWNIEYRRVGQPGGGYPGTLLDVAAAVDDLAALSKQYPLDLGDVSIIGHSAGGHLALWAASRGALSSGQPGAGALVVPRLAIGQGPVVDLVAADAAHLGNGATADFLGGSARDHPDRYAVAGPSIHTTARLVVVRGKLDDTVPAPFTLPTDHTGIVVIDVPGEGHFDLIDPSSASWAAVIAQLIAR